MVFTPVLLAACLGAEALFLEPCRLGSSCADEPGSGLQTDPESSGPNRSPERLWRYVRLRQGKGRVPRLATTRNSSNVNVLIGSGGHGHTFPGATTPWGMVQATPWAHSPKVDAWDTQSGFSSQARELNFYGVAHSALSGAGAGEMGELRLLPLGPKNETKLVLMRDKVNAAPGYFSASVRPARATAAAVNIRTSATPRGAVHELSFLEDGACAVKVLVTEVPGHLYGWVADEQTIKVVSDRRLEGCTLGVILNMAAANAWLCFVVEFDQAFTANKSNGWETTFFFPTSACKTLLARVAVSRTDLEHARTAFTKEVADKDYAQVLSEARASWNRALGTVKVKMTSPAARRIFYTALYHTMISPNLLSDEDGSYRLQHAYEGTFPKAGTFARLDILDHALPVRKAEPNSSIYHTFSAWDTYRSLHPLMNLLQPSVSRDFAQSLLNFFDAWGFLPPWQLVHSPVDMMEGDGAGIILATLAANGLVNASRALALLNKSRLQPVDKRECLGQESCMADGVSELLEQAKADSCVSKLAGRLGAASEQVFFGKRAQLAFMLWDEKQHVFAPRHGGHPEKLENLQKADEWAYREGSPLQYAWSAEFDVERMIELRKGRENFVCALDEFFYGSKRQTGAPDMTGSFGAMSLGNEPTMHVPYLYSLAGYPSRAQELLGPLVTKLFSDGPNGLPGNDDLGQMSSWLVFTMLGFYPVDPCSGEYALGRPFVDEAELELANGTLQIKVNGRSPQNPYVKRLSWNATGQQSVELDVSKPGLTFDMFAGGGLLEFWMSSAPPSEAEPRCPATDKQRLKATRNSHGSSQPF